MPDPLDPQQDAVYRAQKEVFALEVRDGDWAIVSLQEFINGIVEEPWFRARYAHIRSVVVGDGRGAKDAQTTERGFTLPKETRLKFIAVHELAHKVDTSGGEDHGAVFCGCFLFIVGRVYDLNTKTRLSRRFKKYNVTWDHKIAKYGRP